MSSSRVPSFVEMGIAIALLAIACQTSCAIPLPLLADDNANQPPPPPSPPPTRWPPSTPPKPPTNDKAFARSFGYYYPPVTVIGVPRAVYGIFTEGSGPNGEDGCLYYRIDTEELVPDLWAAKCDAPYKLWWYTTLLVICGIVGVVSFPFVAYFAYRMFVAIKHWTLKKRDQLHVIWVAKQSRNQTECDNSVAHPLQSAPTATVNQLPPDYKTDVNDDHLQPQGGAASSSTSPQTHPRLSPLQVALATRAARQANAHLLEHPPTPFNLKPDAVARMADPANWSFDCSCDPQAYRLLLDAERNYSQNTITFQDKPGTPFMSSSGREHRFPDISLQSSLPVPWFPPDIRPPPAPAAHPSIRYFEVTITKLNSHGATLALGLATTPYPFFALPGFYPWSIALHSKSGHVHSCTSANSEPRCLPYAPKPIKKGDTIGVGVDTTLRKVFFTINGSKLGLLHDVQVPLPSKWMIKPCIGVSANSEGCKTPMEWCAVNFNFGTSAFMWKDANEGCMGYALDPEPPGYMAEDVSHQT